MAHGDDVVRWQTQAMESAMDGIAIHDPEGRVLWANAAHARGYGTTPAALLGRDWRELYAPEEIARFEREVMPAFARDGRWWGRAVGRRRDGSTFPQDLSLSRLDGGALLCVVRDVTEREQATADAARAQASWRRWPTPRRWPSSTSTAAGA